MPASEALMESWKRVFTFFMVLVVIVAVVSAFWSFMSYSKESLKLRDARIAAQQAIAEWSETGNQSGVVVLDKVNASNLDPNTTVRIYYANGTLAKNVSSGG